MLSPEIYRYGSEYENKGFGQMSPEFVGNLSCDFLSTLYFANIK